MNRRKMIKSTLLTPVLLLLPTWSFAEGKKPSGKPSNLLKESNSLATALKYKHNGKSVDKKLRKGANEFCYNCSKIKCPAAQTCGGKKGNTPKYIECVMFNGKTVDRDGWCNVWAKK